MSQFPSITGSDLIRALSKAGFSVARVNGSHHRIVHSESRKTTIPVHGKKTLGPGILLKILRDMV